MASCWIARSLRWTGLRFTNCLLVVVASGGWIGSELRGADEALPKAETILDRYIEVTGGKAAYEKNSNMVLQANMEMAPGMTIKLKSYHAPPNRMYMAVEFPGAGLMEQGFDKDVAWEKNPMMGARVRSGAEKEQLKRQAEFNAELRWRELYKECKTVGLETVDGKPSYRVEMIPHEGRPEYQFYDKESGLLLKSVSTMESAMGEATVEQQFSDYRKSGSITVAHRITQKVGPQQLAIVIEKVEYNVEIPADRFEPPAEVKDLLKLEQDAKATGGKP